MNEYRWYVVDESLGLPGEDNGPSKVVKKTRQSYVRDCYLKVMPPFYDTQTVHITVYLPGDGTAT